jgi:hypothetical protein
MKTKVVGRRLVSTRFAGVGAVIYVLVAIAAAATPAFGSNNFYWYGEGGSTCWQTGEPGSPSSNCDSVGAGYLPTPGGGAGGLAHMVEGGISAQVALGTSGDYCGYYRLGDTLKYQEATNQGGNTGFTTPTPYSSYQESDSHQNTCQADGNHWGQEVLDSVSGNGCSTTCGMNHYVSFGSQGTSDRPWSHWLGEPTLVVSAEAMLAGFRRTGSGTDVGMWGYLCPVLRDTASNGILEYCLQEWRSKYNTSEWEDERIGTCASADGTSIDTVQSYFSPGTRFATESPGSASTYVYTGQGNAHFAAGITRTDLVNAINADNSACGRGLSTNPENYALIGVEQGLEGWRELAFLGGNSQNLQLHTEYTPLPPSATTEAATEPEYTHATLRGTVDPDASETHYYFQYGTTTSYGNTTPTENLGSGTAASPVSGTIYGLKPGTIYHFRVVATNAGGTTYGSDQDFRTTGAMRWIFYNGGSALEYSAWNGYEWEYVPLDHAMTGSPSVGVDAANRLYAYYNGGGSLEDSAWNGKEWEYASLHHAISGNPSVAVNAEGAQYVFYNGGGSLEYSGWNGKEWEYVPLHHAITDNPSAGLDAANHLHVFYNGGGSLEYSGWNGKEWEYVPLHHAIVESPAAGVNAAGDEWVFYNGGGSLEKSAWNGKEWEYVPLHHAIEGSPSAAVDAAGEAFVAYNGGGSLDESAWNGKEWEYIELHHAIVGSPSIVINPYTREQWIYYDGGSSLEESAWNGKEWEYVPLHHAMTGSPAAAANTDNVE